MVMPWWRMTYEPGVWHVSLAYDTLAWRIKGQEQNTLEVSDESLLSDYDKKDEASMNLLGITKHVCFWR